MAKPRVQLALQTVLRGMSALFQPRFRAQNDTPARTRPTTLGLEDLGLFLLELHYLAVPLVGLVVWHGSKIQECGKTGVGSHQPSVFLSSLSVLGVSCGSCSLRRLQRAGATPCAPRPTTCGSRAHRMRQGLTLGELGQGRRIPLRLSLSEPTRTLAYLLQSALAGRGRARIS
jgi:hypothetical protein